MLPEHYLDRAEVFRFEKDIYLVRSIFQSLFVVKNEISVRGEYENELRELKEGVSYLIRSGSLNHEIGLTSEPPQNIVHSLEQAANEGVVLALDAEMTKRSVKGIFGQPIDLFRIGTQNEYIGANSQDIAALFAIGKEITSSNDIKVKIGEDLQIVVLCAGEIIGGLTPDYIANSPYLGVRTISKVQDGRVSIFNYRSFDSLKRLSQLSSR